MTTIPPGITIRPVQANELDTYFSLVLLVDLHVPDDRLPALKDAIGQALDGQGGPFTHGFNHFLFARDHRWHHRLHGREEGRRREDDGEQVGGWQEGDHGQAGREEDGGEEGGVPEAVSVNGGRRGPTSAIRGR